jgi:hypothetical protein
MFTFSPSFATRVVQLFRGRQGASIQERDQKVFTIAQYDAAERRQEASYWSIVRYTSPNKLQKLLIGQLALELPAQAPPELHPVAHSKPYHLSALLKPPSSIYAASRAEEPGKLAIFPPSNETWVRLHFAFARLTPELRLARQPKANKPKIVFVPTGRRLSAIVRRQSNDGGPPCLTSLAS